MMKERSQIPGLQFSLSGGSQQQPFSVNRTQRRYDLANAMNSQKGVLTSPDFRTHSKTRLDQDSLL